MRPRDLLVLVTARLAALDIPYCVGGSFASSAYGRARTTFDRDILIAPSSHDLPALVAAFQDDFDLYPAELLDCAAAGEPKPVRPTSDEDTTQQLLFD